MIHSYGATTELFRFMDDREVTKLQALSRKMYNLGIWRVQVSIKTKSIWSSFIFYESPNMYMLSYE